MSRQECPPRRGTQCEGPSDPCWPVMLDEPFRENQQLVIEPNPVTPDLQREFFISAINSLL